MAASVKTAAAVCDPTAAVKPGLKRKRIAVGSMDQYEFDDTCRLGVGAFGAVFKARRTPPCHGPDRRHEALQPGRPYSVPRGALP